MKIIPLGSYLVIKPVEVVDKDESGLTLSMTAKRSVEANGTFSHGEVLAISESILSEQIKVGDKVSVIPGKSGVDKVEYWDGEKVYMMPLSSIVGVITE
ncbi:co-chaperone GroES [Vibrio phage VAP7]|uniref:Co-chaperone GroES n=1 Tax=Vibrio phage VAP7 TaxID=2584487 RepID=A0A4Y5TWK4_9CAUD|nr:co-chaperone GroES [Vibrio phage VAP7]QDB73349.1 co-chaperone GroES [Vibrio phage VAP7]UFD98159.1 hypothetical protein [Vibrio phage BX-1]